LSELLEDRLLVLWRDADARVTDRHLDRSVHRDRPHLDAAPLGRELQGVGQEIQEYLLDLALVGARRPFDPVGHAVEVVLLPAEAPGRRARAVLGREGIQLTVGGHEDAPARRDRRLEATDEGHRLERTAAGEDHAAGVAVEAAKPAVALRAYAPHDRVGCA